MLKKKLQSDLRTVNRKLSNLEKMNTSKLSIDAIFEISIRMINYKIKKLTILRKLVSEL